MTPSIVEKSDAIENLKIHQLLKKTPIGKEFVVFSKGNSMLPLIKDGDKLLVRRIAFSKASKFSMIVFYSNEYSGIVCHRVIGRVGKKILTKGDNVLENDIDLVDEENFLGRVIAINGSRVNLKELVSRIRHAVLFKIKS